MKNQFKIFLSFLIIVNVYISLDHIIIKDNIANNYSIELLIEQNQDQNDTVSYKHLSQSFSLHEVGTIFKKNPKFEYRINTYCSLEQITFSSQNRTALSYKPILLQISINEISIQKSHCI